MRRRTPRISSLLDLISTKLSSFPISIMLGNFLFGISHSREQCIQISFAFKSVSPEIKREESLASPTARTLARLLSQPFKQLLRSPTRFLTSLALALTSHVSFP